MLITILVIIIVGLIGILIGMIIESAFENNQHLEDVEKESEQDHEEIKTIEIDDPNNFFLPF